MLYLLNTFIYEPIVNALVLIYNTIGFNDLGVSIIILTLIVRFLLAPMSHKMLYQQALIQKIRPELLKIQKQHKDNKEKQTVLIMDLYKQHKINPFYMFLVLLVQIPILWALFQLFTNGLNDGAREILYPFIAYPGSFNNIAFGFLNLNEKNIVLIILTALLQFVQIKISPTSLSVDKKNKDMPQISMPSKDVMGIFLAVFTIIVLWRFPSAMAVYWFTTTLFSIGQQFFCNKLIKNAELKRNNN